jgi:hypothetical protein
VRADYEELRAAILDALPLVAGSYSTTNRSGAENWTAVVTIPRRDQDGFADVLTVWEVHPERVTKLITVYPSK